MSTRTRRRKARTLIRIGTGVGAVATAVAASASPAAATCNGALRNYSGNMSTGSGFAGIERYVSLPDTRLFSTTDEFIALWIGLDSASTTSASCPGAGRTQCSVQVGHRYGQSVGSIYKSYFESNGPYGYSVTYDNISLPQNPFYTTFYAGFKDANGRYGFYGYVDNGGGTHQLGGTGWMYSQTHRIQAQAEMFSAGGTFGDHCPTIDRNNSFAYFGTDGTNSSSTNTALYNSTNGTSWSEWTSAVTRFQDYENWQLRVNSAFGARGGGD